MLWEVVVGALLLGMAGGNYPQFDGNAEMRNLLLPADAKVGSVIYRLRATDSDRDYPLRFAATDYGSYVVRVEDLPCSRRSSACEANVFLERSVSPGQVFKFRLTVRDTSGDTTTSAASIKVTDGVTDFQNVFPHIPGVIMIPEDTKVGTELEYVIVRKHPRSLRPAQLELVGGSEFLINQTSKKDTTTGVILLTLPLDYEVKTMYKLSVYAMGMWIDTDTDSRNVAGFELVVVVSDVQDTPPVWDAIAPITMLSPNLTKGDTVLKVTAKDGDRGLPREVRYALVAEKNPFTVFFDIDPVTGVIRLVRELRELTAISRSHQPILLTVVAEEVTTNGNGDSSMATVALLLGERGNSPPFFESMSYSTHLAENSPQGTALVFDDNYITTVKDNDMGKHGVFALSLENNNGTFEISPAVGEREADFVIRVRDNKLLDFEKRKQLVFKIWAREVNPSEIPLSTSVDVTVFITDVNDNPPVFSSANYTAEAPENITAGYRLVRVEASDADTGDFGVVKFTGIYGRNNNSLRIDEDTGLITIATDRHGFDREQSSYYRFQVEARDNKGTGNKARVDFYLFVLDVNDNVPRFLKNPMEFILGPEGNNFTQAAFIKAVDDDSEPPNNVIRYEILSGNYNNRFSVNQESGELSVNTGGRRVRQVTLVATLLVRAYDLGVPTLWTTGEVKILPALSQSRLMRFLLPGKNLEPRSVENTLTKVTGASKVIIHRIQPYTGQQEEQTTDLSNPGSGEKSIVTATILYDKNAVVDLDDLQKKFTGITYRNSSSVIITHRVEEPEPVYRSEARVLFWILLIFLLLLLLGILSLILCCLCSWCPYYAFFNSLVRKKSSSRSRIIAVATEKEKPADKENKSVQAEWQSAHTRREAWSADDRRMWRLGGVNETPRRLLLIPERNYHNQNQQNVVYTRQVEELTEKPRHQRQDILLMEDIDRNEYQILDPSRLREPSTRQSMFIRDGGAEILRLVTRGRNGSEEEPQLNQPQRPFTIENKETEGKVTIMKRFIDDTNGQQMHNKDEDVNKVEDGRYRIPGDIAEESEEEKKEDLVKRVMDLDVERDMSTADVNRLTSIQRDILLTRFLVEEQRRARVEDTQSLPGVVTMATQTDKHAGTQTDNHVYFKRRSKSDNDDSPSDSEETAKRKLKRRRRKQNGTVEYRPASRIEISSPIFEEGEELKPHGINQTKPGLIRQSAVRSRFDDEHGKFRSSSDHESTFRRREVLRSLQVTPIKQMNIINNVLVEHIRYKDPPTLNTQETKTDSFDLSSKERESFTTDKVIRSHHTIREPSITPSVELTPRSQSQGRAQSSRYMDWYKTKKEMREKEKQEKDPIFRAQSRNTSRNKNHIDITTRAMERKKWMDKDEQDSKERKKWMDKDEQDSKERKKWVDKDEQDSKERKRWIDKDEQDIQERKMWMDKDQQDANKKQTINIISEPVKEEVVVTRQEIHNHDSNMASPYRIVPNQFKNQQYLEKKSIFTIAYDDMETKQLRIDSASSP